MDSDSIDRDLVPLAAAGFGAASICFVGVLFMLASPRHDQVFHWHGSAVALFLPPLVYELFLSLAIFAVLAAVRRNGWAYKTVWACLLCLLIFAIAENVMLLKGIQTPHQVRHFLFPLCVVLTVAAALRLRFDVFESTRRIFHFGLMTSAFAGAILFVEVCWCGFEARHLNEPVMATETTRAVSASVPLHGRFFWIVLDELAFKQAFDEHPAGLQLPAFDALKEQSTVFTNVVAAANFTQIAMPSMLSGENIEDVRSTASGRLQLLRAGEGWVDFKSRSTVFSDAQSLGYHNAIAGWYEPYCRILEGSFSSCIWAFHEPPNHLFSSDDVGVNMVTPILHPRSIGASLQLGDFLKLNEATDRLLRAPQYDFVFLHMPIPHPPGLYDFREKKYAYAHTSYVDNLALADTYMGHLRAVLEAQGEWDDATILLMGDHSWRVWIWKNQVPWTMEDELASRHGYDPRPAYLLKLPHQKTGATVNSEFEAVRTRLLLSALMRGQLHTPEDVQKWAAAQPATVR